MSHFIFEHIEIICITVSALCASLIPVKNTGNWLFCLLLLVVIQAASITLGYAKGYRRSAEDMRHLVVERLKEINEQKENK